MKAKSSTPFILHVAMRETIRTQFWAPLWCPANSAFFPIEGERPDPGLDEIAVHSIRPSPAKRVSPFQRVRIRQRLAHLGLARQPRGPSLESALETRKQRHGAVPAHGPALFGIEAADFLLNAVERRDALRGSAAIGDPALGVAMMISRRAWAQQ